MYESVVHCADGSARLLVTSVHGPPGGAPPAPLNPVVVDGPVVEPGPGPGPGPLVALLSMGTLASAQAMLKSARGIENRDEVAMKNTLSPM
jgi:hypothetical protein